MKRSMIVERKGVEKAILPDKVETTIYITTTTLLVLSLEQDQGSSQNCTTQATVMETAPGTTRRLGDVRRKQERSPEHRWRLLSHLRIHLHPSWCFMLMRNLPTKNLTAVVAVITAHRPPRWQFLLQRLLDLPKWTLSWACVARCTGSTNVQAGCIRQ